MRLALLAVLLGSTIARADPKPPRGATKIAIDYTYASFHHNELHYKLVWGQAGYRADNNTTVDGKLVEALYASLTDLRPFDAFDDDIRCISHTDDYPHFTITIEGDSPVVIDSDSNCHANVPWNVRQNGEHYAQFTTDIAKAVYKLLAAVDDKTWKGRADSPEASMGMGGEIVDLGELSPDFHRASPAAVACAKDLETSAAVSKLFGASPKVNELTLRCDLATSWDCSQLVAEATVAWDGVALQIAMPCNQSVVEVPRAVVDQIAEVRAFVDSKPMRALVKLSVADPPRVWSNGDWMSEGQFDDPPMLSFTPGGKTIHVRAMGPHAPAAAANYLKALGIDGKRFSQRSDPQDPFYETELDVDFDGKVVVP